MRVADALRNIRRLFLDTAPIIYLVEQNPAYAAAVAAIFSLVERGLLSAVTSPITLAECLVGARRRQLPELEQEFANRIIFGVNTTFIDIGRHDANLAADLRARYNLSLTDALQVAVALNAGCDAILTNDGDIERVTELSVVLLDRIES